MGEDSATRHLQRSPAYLRWLRNLARKRLACLEVGRLEIVDALGRSRFGPGGGPSASLHVRDPRFWRALATGGALGGAESYMRGWWGSDDLVAVVRVLAANARALHGIDGGLARPKQWLQRALHALQPNTLRGSRKHIAAHYDLGNDFFSLFLDPGLTYSCAFFEHKEDSLEQAQQAKYERICRKLALQKGHHVLEIGSGWGGFAMHAATRYGCHVTTTTISPRQYETACERVAAAGLSRRVQVLFEDYRELRHRYDRLVSIEMIEAVGKRYLPRFMQVCGERLRPDGAMALQAILVRDQDWKRSFRGVDFIKRYIFPGGQLVSLLGITRALEQVTDLRLTHAEEITPHYAETLRRWRERFVQCRDAVRELKLGDQFFPMWLFYLAYCEGGFRERLIGVSQLVLEKPASRLATPMPKQGAAF